MAEQWRYEPDDDSLYWEYARRRRKLRIMALIAAVIVAAMILTLLPRTRRVRRVPPTTEPGVQVLEVPGDFLHTKPSPGAFAADLSLKGRGSW